MFISKKEKNDLKSTVGNLSKQVYGGFLQSQIGNLQSQISRLQNRMDKMDTKCEPLPQIDKGVIMHSFSEVEKDINTIFAYLGVKKVYGVAALKKVKK